MRRKNGKNMGSISLFIIKIGLDIFSSNILIMFHLIKDFK
jgi:hypothetical protein